MGYNTPGRSLTLGGVGGGDSFIGLELAVSLEPGASYEVTFETVYGYLSLLPDCNDSRFPDQVDIDNGTSLDCNGNGVPDECELDFDCNDNLIPDECDIAAGTSEDLNGNGIPDECPCPRTECDDGDICTQDVCFDIAGCSHMPNMYGDVDRNGTVNIFDLLCVLAGFAGDFSVCTFVEDDLHPCAGDDTINIFDLLAVLSAFSGIDPCCGGLPWISPRGIEKKGRHQHSAAETHQNPSWRLIYEDIVAVCERKPFRYTRHHRQWLDIRYH